MLYSDGTDTSVVPTDENLQVVCVPEIDELLRMENSTALPEVDHEHGTFLVSMDSYTAYQRIPYCRH